MQHDHKGRRSALSIKPLTHDDLRYRLSPAGTRQLHHKPERSFFLIFGRRGRLLHNLAHGWRHPSSEPQLTASEPAGNRRGSRPDAMNSRSVPCGFAVTTQRKSDPQTEIATAHS
jgi:hypothetical protein